LERFGLLENLLGEEWLSEIKAQPGFAPPILRAMLMAEKLATVQGSAGVGELIARIKSNDRSAHSELTAAYLLASSDKTAEFGPTVTIKGRSRKPDFRIRSNDEAWCYVEVASPNESELQTKAQELVARIAMKLAESTVDVVLDCVLLKEPSVDEEDQLCTQIAALVTGSASSIETIPELAMIALNQSAPGQAVVGDYGVPPVPRIAITTFQLDKGQTRKTITVRIPFADERAESFVSHEARQLPEDSPGLIMFDMTAAASGMTAWEPLIARRLQPKQHTRISAVCLFSGNYMLQPQGFGWFPEARLLRNSHARCTLPEWIAGRLEAIKLPKPDPG